MNKLPSIINIYKNTLNLYINTFIQVLPFSLLVGLAMYFYLHATSKMASPHAQLTSHDWLIFGGAFIGYLVFSCLIFSIALYGMHQKYHQQPFDYEQAIMKGGARVGQILLSALIIFSPFVILGLAVFLPSMGFTMFAENANNVVKIITAIIYVVAVVGTLILIFLYFYIYVSSVLIVAKGENAWQGLKHSWKITSGHWWKTFFLLLFFGIFWALLSWGLSKVAGNFGKEITSVLMFSLNIALAIVLCDNLEKASQ